jgi:hypothetical protein
MGESGELLAERRGAEKSRGSGETGGKRGAEREGEFLGRPQVSRRQNLGYLRRGGGIGSGRGGGHWGEWGVTGRKKGGGKKQREWGDWWKERGGKRGGVFGEAPG